jgi:hypothetical protein
MNAEEKIGCVGAIAICIILVFTGGFLFADGGLHADVKGQCLKCGYPDYIMHIGVGYCTRLEHGTEVVVPVGEACPQRVEQGKEKP